MNPLLKEIAKQWLIETLRKAGQAGGAVAFEELIATLPPDAFDSLKTTVDRVASRRKVTVNAKVTSSP